MSNIQTLIDAVTSYKNSKDHLVEVEEDFKFERVSEGEVKRMRTMRDDCWQEVLTALARA